MTSVQGQSLIRHIENSDLHAVRQLVLSDGIHIDERDADGQTFLMVASQYGNLQIVKEILNQRHVDVNAVDNDNWSALLNAAKEGYDVIVVELLDAGASVDHKDMGGWTALVWCCYKGKSSCAQILLENHANPNTKGEHHMSCLTWAAGRGNTEIVRMLLAYGAKVNTADKYGTTPLVWACRKGFAEIAEMLIHAGASVDNAGMNSWTALLVAAKGGYSDVVSILLEHSPNVNAVDKDGYTALTWASKDGHIGIVTALLQHGAYVNVPDRYGDTILIHAVKGGHLEVVKALLKKYADVDVQGMDEKTALYWAVDRGHAHVVRALLDFGVNVEISNKDGDTPLLKAVRSRHHEIVRMLMDKHARVGATDKRGDTALHIAMRGRSKRISEALLKNPKDARLLYRPNKSGETPYQIDASKDTSILTQVFGTRNLNAAEGERGYELYSSTIADVLSEPSLNTPINVGLYAKWGSGKSFVTAQLRRDMKMFAEQQQVAEFSFSVLQAVLSVLLSLLCGVVLWLTVNWKVGLGVGLGVLCLQYIILGTLILINRFKDWDWIYYLSVRLQHQLQLLSLLLKILFCNQPPPPKREAANVRFLFTKNARIATVVGEKSITYMIATLSRELEREFGVIATRIYSVFKPKTAEQHGRFKSICCIPYFLIVALVLVSFAVGVIMLGYFGIDGFKEPGYTAVDSILIAIAIIVGIAIIGNMFTTFQILISIVMPPKRRINKIGARLESIKSEGFIQSLKKEVELMGHMTNCMDAFLKTHTRLVVIVDGLDSCEQEKLLQVLDTFHVLFGDQGSPFITILAVDPHIIIKGIESNAHVFFRDSSINGHDYLRNMVQLPFYLQVHSMPAKRFITQQSGYHDSIAGMTDHQGRNVRLDTLISTASQMSLTDTGGKGRRGHSLQPDSTQLQKQPSQMDLSRSLGKTSYFSDINPRSLKRMMNIIAVTGRLLRAYGVDFSWYKLAAWVNITEQWPYRLSWMILEQEDQEEEVKDSLPLRTLYERIEAKLPQSKDVDPLLEIDRNVRKLELILSSHNQVPMLTVGDMRRFLPCTINVDPYLRKLIRELQRNFENLGMDFNMGLPAMVSPVPGSKSNEGTSHMSVKNRKKHLSGESLARSSVGRSSMHLLNTSPLMMANNPYMAPWMNPMLQHQMPVSATPLLERDSGRSKSKKNMVKMQGGLPSEQLSALSIDGVCNMLRRLEGLSSQQLPSYQSRIQDNNISGSVLKTCDLQELKTVMAMSFGDWELFKRLVQMLRDKEDAESSSSASSSNENLKHGDRSRTDRQFVKEFSSDGPGGAEVETPKAVYPREVERRDSSVSIGRRETSNQGSSYTQGGSNFNRRRDSLLTELQSETSAIQGLIDMVGIQENISEEDSEQEDVPINDAVEKHAKNGAKTQPSPRVYKDGKKTRLEESGVGKKKPSKKSKRGKGEKSGASASGWDYESTRLSDDNKSAKSGRSGLSMYSSPYSAGPDDESGSASEKEMMEMVARGRRLSSSRSGDLKATDTSSRRGSASRHRQSIEVKPEIHISDADPSKNNQPGTSSNNSNDQTPLIDAAADLAIDGPDQSQGSSVQLPGDVTPVLSRTTSEEYITLMRMTDTTTEKDAPSAFVPVSRTSSKASSRSGSVQALRTVSESQVQDDHQ